MPIDEWNFLWCRGCTCLLGSGLRVTFHTAGLWYVPVFLRLIFLLRGVNDALGWNPDGMPHEKASALLQDCLSGGCQCLNLHTFPSVNTGLYGPFLTDLLCLLLCGFWSQHNLLTLFLPMPISLAGDWLLVIILS